MRSTAILLVLLASLAGCSNDRPATAAGSAPVAKSELTPEQLGELGARIRSNPSDAERLLSERGLDEKSFTAAVRKVSEDPAASKRYASAYTQTSTAVAKTKPARSAT
jgi:hypothetical protein